MAHGAAGPREAAVARAEGEWVATAHRVVAAEAEVEAAEAAAQAAHTLANAAVAVWVEVWQDEVVAWPVAVATAAAES